MFTRAQWRKFVDSPVVEWTLFGLGVLLIIAGFVIAPLPGPGGVFLIAPGLALVLKTSLWAKRHYARFKKWRFKLMGRHFVPGHWTDLALRRQSAIRRERLRKERERLAQADESGGGN